MPDNDKDYEPKHQVVRGKGRPSNKTKELKYGTCIDHTQLAFGYMLACY